MKRLILRIPFFIGLVMAFVANAQEKSISLEQAYEVVKGYYANYFNQDYWLLAERTQQWEIFVDEMPEANWAHDCTIYKFPNTGDLAVDLVPEIIKPEPQIFPNEDVEPIAVSMAIYNVTPGMLGSEIESVKNKIHTLTIGKSQLNEADIYDMSNCVNPGKLGQICMNEVVLENNAIPDYAFASHAVNGSGFNVLQRISLPQEVESIGSNAFNGCDFENITFPSSVKTLGTSSCANWERIKWIYSEAVIPPVCVGGNAFGGFTPNSTPVYVPIGSAEAYRSAPGWDYFTTFIETDEAPSASIDSVGMNNEDNSNVYWDSGSLILESDVESASYAVYDVEGRCVATGVMSSSKLALLMPQGIYVVKIGDQVHKII
ncbi:MAG: hypothetical protein E7082_02550 [Bacteroidales bacterium]|nr:hypothetical protein [Bacteroidales bacterium]